MAVSKVILNGDTLMDVTVDTVTSDKLLTGYQATGRDGVKVQGSYVPSTASFTTGSADPTEEAQHITPPSGYDGFSYFDVGAIDSDYVGSNIAQNSSADLVANGSKVTAPSGYYAAVATKWVSAGTATTPATVITTDPSISVSAAGLITATTNSSKSVTPTVSAGYISSGTAGTVTASGSSSLQLSTQAAKTVTPTESSQTAVASGKYTTGVVTVDAISSNYVGSNVPTHDSDDLNVSGAVVSIPSGYYAAAASTAIPNGVFRVYGTSMALDIGAVNLDSSTGVITVSRASNTQTISGGIQTSGYLEAGATSTANLTIYSASKTYELSTVAAATITPTESSQTAVASGKYTLGPVTVAAISSNYVGSNIPARSSSNLSASGSIVTAAAGYYANAASKAVAAGTATTPATTITVNPGISVNSSTGVITATTASSKSITPTISAGYINTSTAGTVTVSGTTSSALSIQAATTINPTESEQTAVAAGKFTTGIVSVAAISSDYIGSNIAQNSAADLIASGSQVTVPSGYYVSAVATNIAAATYNSTHSVNFAPIFSVNNSGVVTVNQNTSLQTQIVNSPGYVDTNTNLEISCSGSSSYQLNTQVAKTVTPTESVQTAVASYKYTTGAVKVGAIPSDYIGSAIATHSAADVTVSGPTVNVSSGYYATGVVKTVASGSAVIQSTDLTRNPGITLDSSTGIVTASIVYAQTGVGGTVTTGYISSITNGNIGVKGSNTLQLSTASASTYTPSSATQTIPSGVYLTGVQTIAGDSNLIADNIAAGVSIFGITGIHQGGADCPTFTVAIDDDDGSILSVTCDKTYAECVAYFDDSSDDEITSLAIIDCQYYDNNNLVYEDISGANGNISAGTSSISFSLPDAYDGMIPFLQIIYSNDAISYVSEPVVRRSSSDLIVSGSAITAPAGYYSNDASLQIAVYDGSVT